MNLNKFIKSIDPVLIVEDSISARKFLEILFNEMNLPFEFAPDGKTALNLIRTKKFSIFIIDMILPDLNGNDIIKFIKEAVPDPVILVQTAVESSKEIISTMKLGVFDYIIKPLEPGLFKNVVLKAIDYRRLKVMEINQIERFRNEISKVREIQASFLPDFKVISGFDIAYSILPAEDLSGDFLDSYPITKQNFQIVLCDVAGHGIASSYIGNEIRKLFRIFHSETSLPSEIMKAVNDEMTKSLINYNYLATAAALQVNIATGEIRYCSAGHPASLYYADGEKKFIRLKTKGPLLGIKRNASYSDIAFTINSGDWLVIYSDGLSEAVSEDTKDMFGEDRIKAAFLNSSSMDSRYKMMDILDSIYNFTNYSRQEDDITLMCIRKD